MNILITGGTGLVGSRLTELLLEAGHSVAHLTRDPTQSAPRVRAFGWDVARRQLDSAAIEWAEGIVSLAGASVAGGRWTAARKRAIYDSRIEGLRLLHEALARSSHRVRVLVSASASGYYGDTADRTVDEATPPPPSGADFLANVCRDWEAAATVMRAQGLRVAILRLGVVLTPRGGALPQLALPVKLGVGAPLGTGQQWVPWVHIDDVARGFVQALTDERLTDAYNLAPSAPATNREMTQALARVLHRPLWAPRVPAWALRLLLGEMSSIVLTSCRMTCPRLLTTGFQFSYPDLPAALADFYH